MKERERDLVAWRDASYGSVGEYQRVNLCSWTLQVAVDEGGTVLGWLETRCCSPKL